MYVRSCSETGRQPARISRCNGELSRLAGRQVRAKSRKHHNRAVVLFWLATRQARTDCKSRKHHHLTWPCGSSCDATPGRRCPIRLCRARLCLCRSGRSDGCGCTKSPCGVRPSAAAGAASLFARTNISDCAEECDEDLRNGMAHGWYSPRVPCLGYSSRLLQ